MAALECRAPKAKSDAPAGDAAVICCEGVAPKDKPGWLLAAAAVLAGGCWPKPTAGGAGAAVDAAGPMVALAGAEAPKLKGPGVEAAPAVAAGAAAVAGKAAEAGLAELAAGADPVTWPPKPLNAAAPPAAGAAAVLLPPPKKKGGAGTDAAGALDAAAVLVSVALDPNAAAAADVAAGAVSVVEATAVGPAPPGPADTVLADGPGAKVGREGVGGAADSVAPKLKGAPRSAEVACPLD